MSWWFNNALSANETEEAITAAMTAIAAVSPEDRSKVNLMGIYIDDLTDEQEDSLLPWQAGTQSG